MEGKNVYYYLCRRQFLSLFATIFDIIIPSGFFSQLVQFLAITLKISENRATNHIIHRFLRHQ